MDQVAVEWDRQAVQAFFSFATERHEIFIRRVLERRPLPWTQDPALAGGHYCNTYRILDRVTRDMIHTVLTPSQTDPPADRLFNVIAFRVFNRPSTYARVGGYRRAADWDLPAVQKTLLQMARRGEQVWTGAFMVQGQGGRWAGPGGKIKLWVHRLRQIRRSLPELLWPTMAGSHRALTLLPGLGPFLAYQILLDCTYAPAPIFPFTEDDFVDVGPGAVKGLRYLIADPTYREWAGALRALRYEEQARAATRPRGPELTLANVENCLCEFSKIARLRQPIRPKRTYRHHVGVSEDLSPWDDIPKQLYGLAV